jgi:hypothetical protein
MLNRYPADFPSVTIDRLNELPEIEGIYFAMQDDEVLYVGQSRNIWNRWKNHHKTDDLYLMSGIRVHWLESDGRPLLVQEREWIDYCHPPLNRNVVCVKIIDAGGDVVLPKGPPDKFFLPVFSMIIINAIVPIFLMATKYTGDIFPEWLMFLNAIVTTFYVSVVTGWTAARNWRANAGKAEVTK